MADTAPWREEFLSAVAEIRISNVDKHLRPGEVPVRLCNYMDAYENEYLGEDHEFSDGTATHRELADFGLRVGDIVVTKDSETPDDIGVAAVLDTVPSNLVCGYHLAIIRPRPSVNSVWLMKLFNSGKVRRHLAQRATGSTRYGLSRSSLASVPVPTAPRVEQDCAAEILRCLDQTIAGTEELVAKLELTKRGLLDDLLTWEDGEQGGLHQTWGAGARSLLVRDDPRRTVVRLRDVVARIDAGWSPECPDISPASGDWGVLKVSAVTGGRYLPSEAKTLPSLLKPRPEIEVRPGDVVLARANGVADLVGATVEVMNTPPCLMLSDKLLRLRPREALVRGPYLALLLQSLPVRRQVGRALNGSSGQRNISQEAILRMSVRVPGLDEQDRVIQMQRAIERRIACESAYREELRLIRQGLREDLMSGRIRVMGLVTGESA
jgi:type I restriction enzyme, S subunit